jgi:cytochrome c2
MRSPRNKPLIAGGLVGGAILLGLVAQLAHARYEAADLRHRAEAMTGGSVKRGERAFAKYGCGGCHTAAGQPQASGKVGPPLDGVAARAIIGGRLENKPDNLRLWIENPQRVSPGTAMPNLGVTPHDARDIAAFLYTRT